TRRVDPRRRELLLDRHVDPTRLRDQIGPSTPPIGLRATYRIGLAGRVARRATYRIARHLSGPLGGAHPARWRPDGEVSSAPVKGVSSGRRVASRGLGVMSPWRWPA